MTSPHDLPDEISLLDGLVDDVEPLQMFSIEHWVACHNKGLCGEPPELLAPFPLQLHSDEELLADMERWELLKGDVLDSDLAYLMDALTSNYTHALAGALTLPKRTHTRTIEISGRFSDTGAMTIMEIPEQPTYPFAVVKTFTGYIISAVSSEQGITFNVVKPHKPDTHYTALFAAELHTMFDPDQTWQPLEFKKVTVPTALIEDPAVEHAVVNNTKPPQTLRDTYQISDTIINKLTEVLTLEPYAIVSFAPIISLKDETKYGTHKAAGAAILAAHPDTPDTRHAYLTYATTKDRELHTTYAPATPTNWEEAVLSCFKTVVKVAKTDGVDAQDNPMRSVRIGMDKAVQESEHIMPEEAKEQARGTN